MSISEDELAQLRERLGPLSNKLNEVLMATREPSKAWLVGQGTPSGTASGATFDPDGSWITALAQAGSREASEQSQGKATLEGMGSRWTEGPAGTIVLGPSGRRGGWSLPLGKATLGTSTATGLAIAPNNVVAKLVEIATAENVYRRLMTWRPGIATAGVDIPVEAAVPLRAVVAPFGSTKENVDITFLRYSATLYTISRIHDVGNQLLRFSAGAAEADVVSRLGRAFGLGEAYYILSGAGSTEPLGLLTALGTTGSYVTTKNAATTTFATSIIGTVVSALSTLEARSVKATAVTMHPTDFWKMTQEADSGSGRPYLASYLGGASSSIALDDNSPLNLFGIPVFRDPNLPTGTGLVGDFRSTSVYTGLDFRIDSSSEAGTRWDTNETGFRGEEELGFTAAPYTNAGRYQRLYSLGT